MELVKGIPLTEYCDQQQLTPRERLELFIPICQAVQHAHQKGIIHRDIKPSNILVALYDGRPVPKVIDFGVAKAISQRLTEKTMFTQHGQIVGTLEYMSPEQANLNQMDIDTRSDIYSLGVLLYELLTGATPFDRQRLRSAAFEEMLRIIREEEPPKPSTRLSTIDTLPSVAANRHMEPRKLSTLIRGELDWIVMKALEKDRSRRYETATGLANDIQRYLSDEPVVACPPSRVYRFRKFARRNKVALTTAALVVLAVLSGLVGTTWQMLRANRATQLAHTRYEEAEAARQSESQQRRVAEAQRSRADSEAQRARQEADNARTAAAIAEAVNEFVNQDLLGSADPHAEPDRDLKVRELLDRASQSVEGRFADQPLIKAQVLRLLGDTYDSLGEYEQARRHLERALQVQQEVRGADHVDTLRIATSLAWVDHNEGQYERFRQLLQEILGRCRAVLGSDNRFTLSVMDGIADADRHLGRPVEAERAHREVMETARRVLGEDDDVTLASMHNLALTIKAQGRYEEAERLYREVLEVRRRVLGPEHPETLNSMMSLASAIYDLGRHAEAEELQREVLDIQRRVLGPEHPGTLKSINNVALTMARLGHHAEAETLYREVLEIERRVLGPEHPDTLSSMMNLANAIWSQGRHAEAEKLYREVLDIRRRVLGPEHPDTLGSMHILAVILSKHGRCDEAIELRRQLLESSERRVCETPENAHARESLAAAHDAIASEFLRIQQWAEMHRHWESAMEIREALTRDFPEELAYKSNLALNCRNLATSHRNARRYDLAPPYYERVLQLGRELVAAAPTVKKYQDDLDQDIATISNAYANWSWELSTAADVADRDPIKAVELAQLAIELRPHNANNWNNLGVAQYRAGDWQAAVEALEKADSMIPGGDRAHRMFLAMAHWQLSENDKARALYAQGAAWIAVHGKGSEEQHRFRAEAEQLLANPDENQQDEESTEHP